MQLEGEGAKAPPGEGERISEPTKSYFPAQLSAINGGRKVEWMFTNGS